MQCGASSRSVQVGKLPHLGDNDIQSLSIFQALVSDHIQVKGAKT